MLETVFLGMRMMPEEKSNAATRYIHSLLADPMFSPFECKSTQNTRILSGEEEGLFAWIGVNYVAKAFDKAGI